MIVLHVKFNVNYRWLRILFWHFQQPAQTTPMQPEGQGTPSLSPTPSPAGSVGSVGSQSSSGYSSGGHPATSGQYVSVPLHVYNAMIKQNQYSGLLTNSHDLWDQAIKQAKQEEHRSTYRKYWANMSYNFSSDINRHFFLVFSDFFIDLDRRLGPLTSYSSVRELVRYVQAGIKKLRALWPQWHSPRPPTPNYITSLPQNMVTYPTMFT